MEEVHLSQTLTVRRVRAAEAHRVAEILALAFADDPIAAWVWNDDPALAGEISRSFFRVFAEFALDAGEVHTDESGLGVALWLPFDPAEAQEDPALGEALAAACGPFAERLGILDGLMVASHPSERVHAYLPFIGVAPAGQGRGVGSSLLEARLRDLDREGTPAYLEATTVNNVRLYRRHGFEHMPKTIDLPDGPSMYPMWREPNAA
jgi:ribosomal protein S18 acetylase RimI-like enzyme